MEEDKLNEYNELMSQEEEDSAGNVYIDEEKDYQENIIDEEVAEIGKIKKNQDFDESDDFYGNDEEDSEEDEEHIKENEEDSEEDEEHVKENEEDSEEEIIIKEKPKKQPKKRKAKKASTKKKTSKKKKVKKASTKKKTSKKKKVKKKKNSFWSTFLPLLGILVIIGTIFFINNYSFSFNKGIAAVVNKEEISTDYLDEQYDLFFLIGGIPQEYQSEITKERFLEETLISEVVILQQAKNDGIEVTEQEIETFLKESREQNGMSEEDFNQNLQNQGLELTELKDYLYKQLVSFKLLNSTIFKEIEVTEQEIETIYQSNKEIFDMQNQTYGDVKKDIENMLLTEKQTTATRLYIDGLIATADIEIYYPNNKFLITKKTTSNIETNSNIFLGETITTLTFEETGDELCTEDGKPLIILFSTTTCPHCEWIGDTFDNAVKSYVEQGKIVAYHWQLDLGDNILTDKIENTIPQKHIDLISKYDPQGYVPSYVFGCQYIRIGNGYEKEGNLYAEETEFKTLIEKLI